MHGYAQVMSPFPGNPFPLGATTGEGGTNFAVQTESGESVEVALFAPDGSECRLELPARTGDVFHGLLPEVTVGQRYGIRVHGPWDPKSGLRHNSAKLLLDPHAIAIEGDFRWGQELFGHRLDDPEVADESDSAEAMPRCVVADRSFDWENDGAPRTPLSETIVYETHVKGLTALRPDIPENLRGTYAGLAHPIMTDYLTHLGVTAVELLPVHRFVHDSHLLERGLRNYWGYNSVGFFAPHGEYASAGDGGGQVTEFKQMVKALHSAGLEVILDVVFNHTAEGNDLGPTLSLKGIDNASYYRLVEGDEAHYFDTTGTGNSLNVGHPIALRLVMDSLRYWVEEMHVDGFRFDLATTLTRQKGDLDIHSAFLDLVAQDPVLAPVKLIAEPWDVGDYQLGGFPARWSEWNGAFRDTARDFWRGESSVGDLALRLTGSGDIYASRRRSPTASVNFVTAHDGFTLADLTAYNEKHNESNGDENRDGEQYNRSWNCGEEGATDSQEVLALRACQRRVLLATLLLSAGVPMLLGGDELGRTQLGNNNAYCQDNEISWYHWDGADEELIEFTRQLIALRRCTAALRPRDYLRGPEGGLAQMTLYRSDGELMAEQDWADPHIRTLSVSLDGRRIADEDGETSQDRLMLCVNGHHEPVEFTVPGGPRHWTAVVCSDGSRNELTGSDPTALLGPRSVTLFRADLRRTRS